GSGVAGGRISRDGFDLVKTSSGGLPLAMPAHAVNDRGMIHRELAADPREVPPGFAARGHQRMACRHDLSVAIWPDDGGDRRAVVLGDTLSGEAEVKRVCSH